MQLLFEHLIPSNYSKELDQGLASLEAGNGTVAQTDYLRDSSRMRLLCSILARALDQRLHIASWSARAAILSVSASISAEAVGQVRVPCGHLPC